MTYKSVMKFRLEFKCSEISADINIYNINAGKLTSETYTI